MAYMGVPAAGPVVRSSLFEGGYSDFALIGSIFRIRGTPSLETWPVSQAELDSGVVGAGVERIISRRMQKIFLISASLLTGTSAP